MLHLILANLSALIKLLFPLKLSETLSLSKVNFYIINNVRKMGKKHPLMVNQYDLIF